MMLTQLITDLEAATEGSREIDCKIARLMGHKVQDESISGWPWMETSNPMEPDYPALIPVPFYTTSLDAALTLVPEGRLWSIGSIVNGSGFVVILNNDGQSHRGTTSALALCIAALRARQAMEKSPCQ